MKFGNLISLFLVLIPLTHAKIQLRKQVVDESRDIVRLTSIAVIKPPPSFLERNLWKTS